MSRNVETNMIVEWFRNAGVDQGTALLVLMDAGFDEASARALVANI